MLNSLLAVLGGFATMVLIVMITTPIAAVLLVPGGMRSMATPGVPLPRAYLTTNLLCSALAAFSGGIVTARIAFGAAVWHGVALAAVMVGMSVVSMRQAGEAQPRWYQWTLLTLMPLIAVAGAWCEGLFGILR